jgi:hypothetical protein
MSWQVRLRELGERLTSGEITTDDYRKLSEGILAEADAEKDAETDALPAAETTAEKRVHIPRSAAWEAPSGEMTQIVGTQDHTTVVNASITDKLGDPGEPQA